MNETSGKGKLNQWKADLFMSLTLLFDLDDTLLDTNLEAFVPAYFQALVTHLSDYVAADVMLRALIQGMSLMNESDDPTRTLQEVFEAEFYPALGIPKDELKEVLENFYDEVFPKLAEHTAVRPAAAPLIEWALSCGFRIEIGRASCRERVEIEWGECAWE